MPVARTWGPLVALCVAVAACGSGRATTASADARVATSGDPGRGPAAIARYGCGSCHTIPGVRGAVGEAGPPLTKFAHRTYVAGVLPNTSQNLIRWIRYPQQVVSGNAMPDLGVTDVEARNIAAYLYTLR